jgi:hypothetical protein
MFAGKIIIAMVGYERILLQELKKSLYGSDSLISGIDLSVK